MIYSWLIECLVSFRFTTTKHPKLTKLLGENVWILFSLFPWQYKNVYCGSVCGTVISGGYRLCVIQFLLEYSQTSRTRNSFREKLKKHLKMKFSVYILPFWILLCLAVSTGNDWILIASSSFSHLSQITRLFLLIIVSLIFFNFFFFERALLSPFWRHDNIHWDKIAMNCVTSHFGDFYESLPTWEKKIFQCSFYPYFLPFFKCSIKFVLCFTLLRIVPAKYYMFRVFHSDLKLQLSVVIDWSNNIIKTNILLTLLLKYLKLVLFKPSLYFIEY
jgi:hypothetical protein